MLRRSDAAAFIREAEAELRPSEVKKTMMQIVNHAETLASCIEKLSPNWRFYLRFSVLHERLSGRPVFDVYLGGAEGSGLVGRNNTKEADDKMIGWISDLKKISLM